MTSALPVDEKLKAEIAKRIGLAVAQLLAKAYRGLSLLGLPSANIYSSPKKEGENFTDMHGYSSG